VKFSRFDSRSQGDCPCRTHKWSVMGWLRSDWAAAAAWEQR